ncbi:MAG TPA: DUF424 family protein [Nitrososphaera sp.]|nr:DUF424 family protein [Nitrososphaera sp.]
MSSLAKFAVRTSTYQGSMMVDICDLDIVGAKLEEGELVVNLNKDYYMQQVLEYSGAGELLKKCDIANLVGDSIVALALEMKMAKELSIKRISGVPFLMIFKFRHSG